MKHILIFIFGHWASQIFFFFFGGGGGGGGGGGAGARLPESKYE
jgi:hypothetical protein